MPNAVPLEPRDQDPDWARPLYVQQINFLGELAEEGMEIARDIAIRTKAAEDIETAQAGAAAYAKVARAVRLTLLLQAKLIKDLVAYDRHQAWLASSARQEAQAARADLAEARKARIERIVERIADDHHGDSDKVDRLVEETTERLDQDDLCGDILSRPVSELVAMICQDLGLSPDWPRLAEEAWALEEMGSGSVGWPLKSRSKAHPPNAARPALPPHAGEVARDAPAARVDGGSFPPSDFPHRHSASRS